MVCSIIDECRCYAYDDLWEPKKTQFCGVRSGPRVVPCPEKECCAGGCPGEVEGVDTREPFRTIKRPTVFETTHFNTEVYVLILLIMFSLVFLTYLT